MIGNRSSLGHAAAGVDAIIAGPLVLAICSIAIAALGLAMFAGKLDIRRGATAIVGCFIVLGASTIANGMMGHPITAAVVAEPALAPLPQPQSPRRDDRKAEDPYAGASLAH